MERQLAAILAADVVGYSRLMGEDEAGTLAALQSHREELIEPKAAQYHGRTVKLMGDGALMEFGSVVDAVSFAVEVQIAMRQRNSGVPEDRQIIFRIGINLGDIILQDEDIYGDGVNVAARLEGLAEPGGICLSRAARDQVRDKLDLRLVDLGEVEVKNISRPVRAFQIILDDNATALVTPVVRQSVKTERRQRPLAIAAVVALLLAASGTFWWQPWAPDVEPASVERMAFPLPDKPSIAVLAFDNLSQDPKQEYLSDGFSERIITELSRFPDFFVIARNSTFVYKGKAVKVQQVAEELGVRYVLEGSVQREGGRVRVTAQLIDATGGKHLWAEYYDRDVQDIFAVQDEITQTIVATLAEKVDLAERERATRRPMMNLQAYELHQRGRQIWMRWTKEANEEARKLYERAMELDPKYPGAYRSMAWTHINDYRYRWSEFPEKSIELAFDAIQEAVALDPFSHRIRWTLAKVYSLRGEHDQALQEFDRALELNPNAADVIIERAELLVYTGQVDEALSDMRVAMRLNPHHPNWYHWSLGWVLYHAGQHEEALVALKKLNPFLNPARHSLAAVYVRLGRIEEAKAEVEEFLKQEPDYSLENEKTAPYKDPSQLERWIDDLRKAGFPE